MAAGAVDAWSWRLQPKAENRLRNSCRPGEQPKVPWSKRSVRSAGPPSSPISKRRRWPSTNNLLMKTFTSSSLFAASAGQILPAREQLAELLAELGRPADALAEFESSLKHYPNRFNAHFGAGRTAEKAGQPA